MISVAETWLLTLAVLSPHLCANKVIRIELREADAQEELRQDAEQLKSTTRGADPMPKATPAPGRNPPLWPAVRHCRSCKSGFWRALPGGWGPTGVGRRKKGALPITKGQTGQDPPGWEQRGFSRFTVFPRLWKEKRRQRRRVGENTVLFTICRWQEERVA